MKNVCGKRAVHQLSAENLRAVAAHGNTGGKALAVPRITGDSKSLEMHTARGNLRTVLRSLRKLPIIKYRGTVDVK